MTGRFDELRVLPDPLLAEDLRRRLHAEMERLSLTDPAVEEGPVTRSSHPRAGRQFTTIKEHDMTIDAPDNENTSRRWMAAAAAVLVAVVGAAGIALVVNNTRADDDAASQATAPVTTSTPIVPTVEEVGDRLQATIPVANTADSIAVADDAVWVAGWDGRLVSRIDVANNEVTTVDVGSTGTRVSVGAGGVWVGVDDGEVIRLDPVTAEIVARIDVGDVSVTPLAADDVVWVFSEGSMTLSRIDPLTNEVTSTVDVTSGQAGIGGAVVADGVLWLSLCDTGVVSVDADTMVPAEPINVNGCAGTIGYLDGDLWVARDDHTTIRVDPASRAVEAVIDVGPEDGAPFLSTSDGAVWVPLGTATVARIDPASNSVVGILDLGRTGQIAGLAFGHGSLWAGDYGASSVLRIAQ